MIRWTLILAVLSLGRIASAATFTVLNLNDAGPDSLRQAVIGANTTAGADTIAFQPGLTGTIVLTTGQLDITDSLTILGPGSAVLAVSGNQASRILNVAAAPVAPQTIVISGLTIASGLSLVSGDVDASAGGAIRVAGESLSLDDVRVVESVAGGAGGGIAFSGLAGFTTGSQTVATLTLTGSEVSDNASIPEQSAQQGPGGGIFVQNAHAVTLDNVNVRFNFSLRGGGLWVTLMNAMPLTITRSRFFGNTAGYSFMADGFEGGGIGLHGVVSATIDETEMTYNRANVGFGGAVSVDDSSSLTLRRSTLVGNSSSKSGGGIAVRTSSTLVLENSTLDANYSDTPSGGTISLIESTAQIDHVTINNYAAMLIDAESTATIANSIIYGGQPSLNNEGGAVSVSYSLIGSSTGGYTDLGGNIVGQNPLLALPAYNGGPTQTRLPSSFSPVINAGNPAFVPPPSVDQRGLPRVEDGRIDMGAVELDVQYADLEIVKSITGPLEQGQSATFHLVMTNHGPDAVPFVLVSDTLPPGVSYLSATPSQGLCSETGPVRCSLGALAVGGTATIDIEVALVAPGPFTNTATATSSPVDPAPANNSGSVTFTIAPAGVAGVPTLDPIMLLLLAASLAAAAMLMTKR